MTLQKPLQQEDEDLVETMLKQTGCIEHHYKLQVKYYKIYNLRNLPFSGDIINFFTYS